MRPGESARASGAMTSYRLPGQRFVNLSAPFPLENDVTVARRPGGARDKRTRHKRTRPRHAAAEVYPLLLSSSLSLPSILSPPSLSRARTRAVSMRWCAAGAARDQAFRFRCGAPTAHYLASLELLCLRQALFSVHALSLRLRCAGASCARPYASCLGPWCRLHAAWIHLPDS